MPRDRTTPDADTSEAEARVASFEAAFEALRYPLDVEGLRASFTAEAVGAYVRAKGRLPDDRRWAHRDVLRAFPTAWWRDEILAFAAGERTSNAFQFVRAAFDEAPDLFADAPAGIVRWISPPKAWRFLRAHDGAAALARAARDPSVRWRSTAAAWLLLLDESQGHALAAEPWLDRHELLGTGFDLRDGTIRRLWPRPVRHLIFPPGYLKRTGEHPTFHPDPGAFEPVTHAFGGRVGELHHVITLDPVPSDLGLSVDRLTLAIDLGWSREEGAEQYFRHAADGSVARIGEGWGIDAPPFAPARVSLARGLPEHAVQDWGASNGEENLARLGGLPVFVQYPGYPGCPGCGATMVALLSLDSGLPLSETGADDWPWWDWGSGGVANAFWCDGCRISAWSHQNT